MWIGLGWLGLVSFSLDAGFLLEKDGYPVFERGNVEVTEVLWLFVVLDVFSCFEQSERCETG